MSMLLPFKRRPERASVAFETFLKPHFAAVYSAASRLTASNADAEDLLQEVCIKAWQHIAELRNMDFPRAWLLRALYNLFIDDKRRQQRSPLHLAAMSRHDEELEYPGPEGLQPDREVERAMRIESIWRAMKLLGREQCSLLSLHDIEGLSLQELQSLTQLPIGTIKSKLHRARLKLGRLLAEEAPAAAHRATTGIKP